jgi:TolB-like protein/Tfp pilus assembly protein PilF
LSSFLTELNRRNVIKVALFYIVAAWLVLQAGDILFELIGLPDWTLKLVLGVLLLGFPLVLTFSWIYEMTPEGLKLEKDVDRSQSITPQTGQKVNVAIMVGLAVAIALMLYEQFGPGTEVPAPETIIAEAEPAATPPPISQPEPEVDVTGEITPSIAVLPFVDMSPDKDQEYFADGLADTLMHMLAQVGGLKVAARTSSFAFKGQNINVSEIARELKVGTVLEGSVQKAGNRVRVIAQLIEVVDGTHIWSANFDRDLVDIFAIQDEIAKEVVSALKVTLLDAEETRLTNRYQPTLEAYEQMILGRGEMAARTAERLDAAERYFKRAIELDPDYALAYVGLADTYALQQEYSDLVLEEAWELRQQLVDKALELDPDSGEAHTNRADLLSEKQDFDAAERAYLKAIDLNPNYATAHHWYSRLLRRLGRFEEALTQIRVAAELDPMAPIIQVSVAESVWDTGRVEEALSMARRNIERNPEFPNHYALMAAFQRSLGNLGQAMIWTHEATRRNPEGNRFWECVGLIHLEDDLSAEKCANRYSEAVPDKFSPIWVQVLLHGFRQESEAAQARMESILERTPDSRFATLILANILVKKGETERARRIIAKAYPELLEDEIELSETDLFSAFSFASALHANGETKHRDRLFSALERRMETMHRTRGSGYGITDMHIHAMRGDHDLAIAALREAIDDGWRTWWWGLRTDWRLTELLENPEFIALVEELEADIRKQRQWYEENKDKPLM